MDKDALRRLNLKNGWDLPDGEPKPLTGRKQQNKRAYELLVEKPDEDYVRDAQGQKLLAEKRKLISEIAALKKQMAEKQTAISPTEPKKAAALESELRDTTGDRWKQKRKIRIIVIAAVLAAVVLGVGGRVLLGPPILVANISNYEDVEITIEGLTDEPFTVTPKELSKMKLDSVKVPVHEEELEPDEEPERGRAIGPTLETFLAGYDLTIDDVRSMKAYSQKDEGTAYVRTLEEKKIILSVANGRWKLGEKEAPLRIAVEDTNAGEWSGWIRRIVFVLK